MAKSNEEKILKEKNFRLCRLCGWSDYPTFGFDLTKESGALYVVRSVESNSPAAAGGLRIRDVILAINDEDVSQSTRKNIEITIESARERDDRIKLLVIEEFYYNTLKNDRVSFHPKFAQKLDTPRKMPYEYMSFPKYTPRTCDIRLQRSDASFGFELVSGENGTGVFIQEVIGLTPASETPLRKCDRIIEINDEFVDDKPYKSILEKIAQAKEKHAVKLYVVDTHTYAYFQQQKIPLPSKEFQRTGAKPVSTDTKRPANNSSYSAIGVIITPNSLASKESVAPSYSSQRECRLRRIPDFRGYGFKMQFDQESDLKHKISHVVPNSPAEQQGLRVGDYIISFDGKSVQHMNGDEFTNFLRVSIIAAEKRNGPLILEVVGEELPEVVEGNYEAAEPTSSSRTSSISSLSISDIYEPVDYLLYSIAGQPTQNPLAPRESVAPSYSGQRECRLRRIPDFRGYGFKMQFDQESDLKHKISHVVPNSPAEQQGLRVGDYIISFDGKSVQHMNGDEFTNFLRVSINAAEKRNGPLILEVVGEELPEVAGGNYEAAGATAASSRSSTVSVDEEFYPPMRICTIKSSTQYKSPGFQIKPSPSTYDRNHGYQIQQLERNSPAAKTYIENDDYIIQVNNENIEKQNCRYVKDSIDNSYQDEQQVTLLVIDADGYQWYKTHKYPIDSSSPNANVTRYTTPDPSPMDILKENDENQSSTYRKSTKLTSRFSASANPKPSINVCRGDIITQQTDVIVICSSSKFLFEAVCTAGGDSVQTSFDAQSNQNPKPSVIAVKSDGKLASKIIYFLPWEMNTDKLLLRKSFEKFVSDALEKAIKDKYQSIAFPAIGCGQFGCSISLVAQTMVEEAHRKLQKYPISTLFVIQTERTDIYDEFQKQIRALPSPAPIATPVKTITATVDKGIIEVEKGDITAQKVDVIIGSSSSEILKKAIIKAAGDEVQTSYNTEFKNNSNAILISTLPGALFCKRIFFVKWEPVKDEAKLRQSIIDLVWIVIQNVIAYKFTSLAFPALGCGQHGCSVDVVVKTMVKEMKKELTKRGLQLTVRFVIQPDQQNIYDEFCKQVLEAQDDTGESFNYQLPATWEKSNGKKMRFGLSARAGEYKSIVTNFDQAMKGKYTQIIRIERIQNERWYIQYLAHSRNFKTLLNTDTEKCLYHGCPEQAASSIMVDGFNRSFAGVNGTVYGVGVYFSSNATYSHGYAVENVNGERNMFLARVLVGKTTIGDKSMKTRPVGFDSTTDGDHIFVTYHDAQAYAEYLITYK